MLTMKRPVHPGEVLREEFMEPLGLSAIALARAIGVPRTRIERVRDEATGVTADTALRLGALLGTSPEFWMNLQANHDLARERASFAASIDPHPGLPTGPVAA